ncbi:bifunctional phosphopantothenoylcysteine decarboxylase/phosphopantothenate--cysteine ligase CoaBC [Nigerium massiliense]|uniref:bifunctional phosphopantothenoylcysteine decarboxylase/phosphopantothenate--cysteine ligase CoaBC n=1 Tax=Nigerium massiliense TaxID=1522317 RepID=UPI00058E1921|nr:bifunctional phosphopantothenoylcysteine decarboxylase/phosphopantothenate--cysteine ligase CoaBC [Nigerium massiliense]
MSRILLGVAGGIAAYKACELLRRFSEGGHEVTVVPTRNALTFVGEATWAALSGRPVRTEVWSDVHEVPHVRLGQEADLVVVAPATADLLARAAGGRADDLLTNVLLTARCPVLMAPAMHTEMWRHPATVANVATLRERGTIVMDPADGRLTGADSGPGRLPDPDDIHQAASSLLGDDATVTGVRTRDLAGLKVVVSAGGTHEALDPVRFLGNASSGRQGLALARAAALRGGRVTLAAANVSEPTPSSVEVRRVVSTGDLGAVMREEARDADIVVMAAAPADFTPAASSQTKLKKQGDAGLTLELRQTMDVLATISSDHPRAGVIVGFAAETAESPEALLELGRAKLARKGCDLLVCNNVSGGAVFGAAGNAVTIIDRDRIVASATADKNVVAHRILDAALGVRARQHRPAAEKE